MSARQLDRAARRLPVAERRDLEALVESTGKCVTSKNPEAWFPKLADSKPKGEREQVLARRRAFGLCAGCLVITECRALAADRREAAGVWGGEPAWSLSAAG